MRLRRYLVNTAIIIVSLAAAAFVAEWVLRAAKPKGYFVWQPGLEHTFHPRPEIMPGMSGESKFTINKHGIRGDNWSWRDDYRILCIGGSTTECLYLDNTETWPYLLQENLRRRLKSYRVWVGNVGKSGLNSWHYKLQAEKLLRQYTDLDAIFLLVGINDMAFRLAKGKETRSGPPFPENRAFMVVPVVEHNPIYRFRELRGRIDILLGREKLTLEERAVNQDDVGEVYNQWRANRRNARVRVDEPPDLTYALDMFEKNLGAIIDLADSHGLRTILATQPSLWRPIMRPGEEALLWYGRIGLAVERDRPYYTVNVLRQVIESFNNITRRLARERGATLVDLAPIVPKTTEFFYDDVHFNENGARFVADAIADQLIMTEPFREHMR